MRRGLLSGTITIGLVAIVAACSGFFPDVGAIRTDDAGLIGVDSPTGPAPSNTTATSGGPSNTENDSGTEPVDGSLPQNDGATPNDANTGPRTWNVVVGPGDNDRFEPNRVTIKLGDTVKWTLAVGGHNIISDTGLFCSPNNTNCASPPELDRGDTFSVTFSQNRGTFAYHCGPHEDDNMKGTIIVE